MTNGEKFKEIFPIMQVDEGVSDVYVWTPNHDATVISIDWWNAEYKEPTTKNDLGVDCISRADAIQAMQDKAKKLTNEDTINGLCGAVAILFDLPSVTPQELKTGHWNNIPKYKDIAWQCSECKHFTTMKHNFCPNCGCHMVEPQESEE